MSDIYDDIQEVLEFTLSGITDLPEVDWENVDYRPTTGTSYIKPRLLPTGRSPSVLGTDPIKHYQGIFMVDCMVPENTGRSEATALVSKIINSFDASEDLSVDDTDTVVTIRYAERDQGIPEGPFYRVPVRIGWQAYA